MWITSSYFREALPSEKLSPAICIIDVFGRVVMDVLLLGDVVVKMVVADKG